MKTLLLETACVLSIVTAPIAVYAQSPVDDPVERARIQIGPLGITPSIAVVHFGVDSNVFREELLPKSDVTATISPGARAWLRAGRSLLAVDARGDMQYFQHYASERSLDSAVSGRYEIRSDRITPWVGGGYSSGRQRVGYDIDVRSQRVERQASAGLDVRVMSKTEVGISARRIDYSYDADARVLGTSLKDVLNRRSESAGVSLSHELTPITRFVVQGESIRDRFAFSPGRDADSMRVLAGVNLDSSALISGTVRAGYRTFDTRDGTSSFTGLVASADAAYTVAGRTRFDIGLRRDLNYSFEVAQPFYLLTGADLTVTPQLSTHWDLQARSGQHQLAYRDSRGASGRNDHHSVYGIGVGYRMGSGARIGANLDREQRGSAAEHRQYNGYKMGVSMTYGR